MNVFMLNVYTFIDSFFIYLSLYYATYFVEERIYHSVLLEFLYFDEAEMVPVLKFLVLIQTKHYTLPKQLMTNHFKVGSKPSVED